MPWILFYDGGCNLCHASQLRVERWAIKAGQELRATPLQSEEGIAKGYPMDGMVLEADGVVYSGGDAWLELMKVAPWYLRWLFPIRKIPAIRELLKWGYGIVAKYRHKWFGRRECKI